MNAVGSLQEGALHQLSFRPDEHLAKILSSNGYKEVISTGKRSVHNLSRRTFAIYKKNITTVTPYIEFENGVVKENMLHFYEQFIYESQLRTIICFHKISGTMGIMIRNKFRNSWNIQSLSNFFVELSDEKSDIYLRISAPLRKKIISAYDNVIVS